MIKENHSSIVEIIESAGEILKDYFKKLESLSIYNKPGEGLVSEADIETEKFLIKEIKKLYPKSNFIAEESYQKEKKEIIKNSEIYWLLDPLDGTNNFLSGFDYFSISLAAYFNEEVIAGFVYRPVTQELFFSYKGEGAFQRSPDGQKKKIKIKNINLKSCMLTTGFCVEKGQEFDKEFDIFKDVMTNCRGIRRLGSAALDLCYSSSGPWGGFWERELSPWDVAAGALVVLESGGKVTSYTGEKFSPFSRSIVASSDNAHQELLELIGKN